MAQNYTRQSTLSDGDTITASLFNDEYNQLVNAFTYSSTSASSTGHRHDGSAGQGGNIFKIGDLDFLNKIEVDSTNNRWGFYVEVSSAAVEQIRIQDGSIVPVTTNDIDLGTASLQFKDLYIDGTANVDSLTLTSGSTVTTILDEDDLSSDSATALVTQQSVKAYIDAQVTAQDFDFQADSGGALSIDLDSETMTFTGGTGIDTSGSGNAVTFAIDSTVTTLTGTQTLTNKTLTSPDVNTPDIDGGTIDGTVIGGTTPAAVSATTVSATGNITVGGTVDGRDVATDGTKLDGIESGATADQTAAEIRTLVESATDSNVFTDADHTKLDGIEAGADVTDTANVTAAGAVMDSELTNETAVKALNQGVATTDSPTFAGLTTTADVSFGDNDKAIFGAGSDLQIYHDSNLGQSRIQDVGTGSLYLQGDAGVVITNSSGTSTSATFASGGATSLSYNGTTKFATTGTGIDVTGTVTADRLKTDSGTNTLDIYGYLGLNYYQGDGIQRFYGNSGNRLDINGTTGDISFYEDTGTTAKLTWDASAETLNFADNGKAIFGASSDLQIYHDGLNSHITDAGSGNLILQATDFVLKSGGTGAYIEAASGVTKLYHSNALKLATTSTGVDVTGTLVSDGLTVDGFGQIRDNLPYLYLIENDTTDLNTGFRGGDGQLQIRTFGDNLSTSTNRFAINHSTGDISFYEDTGTTAKFFWDASDEALRVGSTSAIFTNSVIAGVSALGPTIGGKQTTAAQSAGGFWNSDTGTVNLLNFYAGSGGTQVGSIKGSSTGVSLLGTGGEGLTVYGTAGNVGIGTSSPFSELQVDSEVSGTRILCRSNASGGTARLQLRGTGTDGTSSAVSTIVSIPEGSGTATAMAFEVRSSAGAETERMRIDSAGNVGIGTSSPASKLHVNTGAAGYGLTIAANTQTSLTYQMGIDSSSNFAIYDSFAASQRMVIDTSGNVGIGTSSPTYLLNAVASSGSQAIFQAGQSGVSNGYTINSNGTDLTHQWYNDASEAMRLTSAGNLLVGTTSSQGKFTVEASGSVQGLINTNATAGSGDRYHAVFYESAVQKGSITSNGTATSYNTSSDQRLKENIVDAPSASDDIDAIQVRSFDWKADGSHQKYGMVAQELQTVAPEAVSEGATEEDMMGVDYSKLVPMLVKEIQSLRARVAQLETN